VLKIEQAIFKEAATEKRNPFTYGVLKSHISDMEHAEIYARLPKQIY